MITIIISIMIVEEYNEENLPSENDEGILK